MKGALKSFFLLSLLITASTLSPQISLAQKSLTIATFNCEFLTKPKVHVKFGYPFNITKSEDRALWNQPGYRDERFNEAAKEVAAVLADGFLVTRQGELWQVDRRGRDVRKVYPLDPPPEGAR